MMTQGSLHFEPPTKDPLERAFLRFHSENPHIARLLAAKALKLRECGERRWGIGALFESLRYDLAVQTRGAAFKLNNNHRAFYVRLLEDRHPELQGFFSKRRSAADGKGKQ